MLKKKEVLAVFAVIIMLGTAFGNVVFGASRNEKEENDARDARENVVDVGFPFDNDETGGDINNGYVENGGKLENTEKVTLGDDSECSFERDKSTYDWPTFHHDMQRTGFSNGISDISTPSIKWLARCGGLDVSYYSAVGDIDNDGELEVILSFDDKLCVMNGSTGEIKWTRDDIHGFLSSVCDIDGDGWTEIITQNIATVYCLNGSTGDTKWMQEIYPTIAIVSSPGIGDINNDGISEVIVTVMATTPDFFILDGQTGEVLYNRTIWGSLSSPAIYNVDGVGDSEIVIGSEPTWWMGEIKCLNSDGSTKWDFETGHTVDSTPTIADVDNDGQVEVVVGCSNNNVYCLDGASGSQEWVFSTNGSIDSSPAVGDVDGDGNIEVIFGSYDNNVYCVNGSSGNEKWHFTCRDKVICSAVIADIDSDGVKEIIIGSKDKNLYSLNGITGEEEWNFTAGAPIGHDPYTFTSSPSLADLDNDGNLEIVVTAGSHIYCLQNDFGPQPPVVIMNGPYRAGAGDVVHFSAADSWDPDGFIVGYRWDWENDGIWDTEWLTEPTIDHVYNDPFNGTVAVQVKDDENLTSVGTESILIDPAPPMAWNKTYGSGYVYSIQQTSDGGYIFSGKNNNQDVLITKTGCDGNILWNKTYGKPPTEYGLTVQETSDGGYIIFIDVSGENTHVCLLRLSSSGAEMWNKSFPNISCWEKTLDNKPLMVGLFSLLTA